MSIRMNERTFLYYPGDFGEPVVRVLHMDLTFDVYDDHTRVVSHLTFATDRECAHLALNAKNLEIRSASCEAWPLTWEYDTGASLLQLRFGRPVPAGTTVTVTTDTVCHPTHNILEGLYYDETPAGAPPTQITQCQQWGFQRLVPCIDDMTAKCTFSTTIIADERYTSIISNGDAAQPRQSVGGGRAGIRYENRITPMAPYLFFLGCGTYATFRRECEYPDGHPFALELLVPPSADPRRAGQALDILFDSILWIYLFTGPGTYDHRCIRQLLYDQATKAYRLAASGSDPTGLEALRSGMKSQAGTITTGYRYTGSVYREIGMQNSDFGGMENVGNTTITTNRIMPFPAMTDPAYEYMANVKVHEFYHNLNGSEVTGHSPFEIWLNEAVTVHIENQYHAFHFGEDYSRLGTVISLVAPGTGTLALDSGTASMPIEPEGFNDPNELITDITYVKGPEFVRMIETLMGKETFVQGLDLYHRRYRHGNATRAQWIAAMEEVSGQDFAGMAKVWLTQTGFPTVTVTPAYDPGAGTMTLNLVQSGFGKGKPWTFPFRVGLVDESGNDITEMMHQVGKETETIRIPVPRKPAFLSLNRGYSFYGRVACNTPPDELYLQAEKDRDISARFLAFLAITDREKTNLLPDPGASPDPRCCELFFRLLSDEKLMHDAGGQFLTLFDSVQDARYAHRYQALWEAKEKILSRVASLYEKPLLGLYEKIGSDGNGGDNGNRKGIAAEVTAIKQRSVRNTCLAVLARLDTPAIHRLLKNRFDEAANATDRLAAFSLILGSSSPDRLAVLDAFGKESARHPVSWENYLAAVAGSSSPDIVGIMTGIEQSESFRIEQSNDQRALYRRFAMNRKKSLQTGDGRAFLEKTLLRLAAINEFSTVAMLQSFDAIDLMEEEYHVPLVGILVRLMQELDPAKAPSVYNTARRILAGSPLAVARYERESGPVPLHL